MGTWLLIATVGRLPSIVTSTVGGSALGEQNYRAAVIAFALALAVAGVGYVIYRAVCRRHGQNRITQRPTADEPSVLYLFSLRMRPAP